MLKYHHHQQLQIVQIERFQLYLHLKEKSVDQGKQTAPLLEKSNILLF